MQVVGNMPKWRNWQTRRTQNPVLATECGFDSHLRHHVLNDREVHAVSALKSRFTAAVMLGIAALLLASFTVGACGNKDPWAGTWVMVDDAKTSFVIEAKGDGYYIHYPDGSNAFDAKLGKDGALHGTTPMPNGKNGEVIDVVVTKSGENIKVEMTLDGKPAYSAELKRQ